MTIELLPIMAGISGIGGGLFHLHLAWLINKDGHKIMKKRLE